MSKTRVVWLHLERRATQPKNKGPDLKAADPTFQTGSQPANWEPASQQDADTGQTQTGQTNRGGGHNKNS